MKIYVSIFMKSLKVRFVRKLIFESVLVLLD